MFEVKSGNQQGLATDGHYVWVSFDAGKGMSKIATYTWKGVYVGTSAALPLGHAAEMDYRVKDNSLYVVNGGLQTESTSADTKVYRVTLDSKHIARAAVKIYDFAWLGRNGLVAVDNAHDLLVTMGGPDAGPWKVTVHQFGHASASSALNTFTVADPGVLLQGLAYINNTLWLYVSQGGVNRIDKFDITGRLLSQTTLSFTGEAEGLTVNPLTGSVYVGAHSGNRVLRVSGL
jgi:DNA-binding beta-propeller fold protein YncE